jgi:LysR family hydrogen peroxide-inducible transcriptional activator
MITLRQLRYLTALARHRHFGRAAEDCAVTQPALSMQVRELEREIGVDLVERRPGDTALTDTGLDVAQRAEQKGRCFAAAGLPQMGQGRRGAVAGWSMGMR